MSAGPPGLSLESVSSESNKRPTKDKTLETLFHLISNNKESISFDIFHDCITSNEVKLADNLFKEDLQQQWNIIDVDGNDEMDLHEFKSLMNSNFGVYDKKRLIQVVFNEIKKKLLPDDKFDLLERQALSTRASILLRKNVAIGISKKSLLNKKEQQKKMESKLKMIFETIDADGSGTIEIQEMWKAVTIIGIDMTYDELEKVFNFYDSDKTGTIEFPEFKRWLTSTVAKLFGDGAEQFTKAWTVENISKVQQSTRASKQAQMNKPTFNFSFDTNDSKDESKDTISDLNHNNYVKSLDTKKGTYNKKRKSQIIEKIVSEYEKPLMEDVKKWNIDKVCEWVKYIFKDNASNEELELYVKIFKKLEIDGKKLVTMNHRTDWFALKFTDDKGNVCQLTNKNGKRHITYGYRRVKRITDPNYNL